MLRARLSDATLAPYLALVMNHPIWRLLSLGWSAGKRQDNLSQEALGQIPIPFLPEPEREKLAAEYTQALEEIHARLVDDTSFARLCDDILARHLGMPPTVPSHDGDIACRSVTLSEVARGRLARLDNRWHGAAYQNALSILKDGSEVTIESIARNPLRKGRQPRYLPEGEEGSDACVAISTACIQDGTIVWDDARAVAPESVAHLPLGLGDLLVAMDGDGSLGKAAIVDQDLEATTDSHLARVRLHAPHQTAALACFLNSSWGRIQTTALMAGATGQTQLSLADLASVVLPAGVNENAAALGAEYIAASQAWESPQRGNRRLLCNVEALLTEELWRRGSAKRRVVPSDIDGLLGLLDLVYPRIR